MNSPIFRKSSIDRVNSPEQLNEYIRVTNPGVWLILTAVVVLLAGVILWGMLGRIETTVHTGVEVYGSTAFCYVSTEDASQLEPGLAITAGEIEGTILSVAEAPLQVNDSFPDYLLYLTGLSRGDFCYAVEVALPGAAEGFLPADITVDSVHPISFVIH